MFNNILCTYDVQYNIQFQKVKKVGLQFVLYLYILIYLLLNLSFGIFGHVIKTL